MNYPILELRVALTTRDYERLVKFYCDGLGLEPSAIWNNNGGQALILDMGKATLELFDQAQAETIDQIEAGRRMGGQIRFALQVPDLNAAMERLLAHGATLIHEPVMTPWGDYKVRLQDPDGMQITLFQASNDVQLRDVIQSDLPIFFEQQLDPEATQMAAFPSRGKDAFTAHWNKIMADDSGLIKTILFHGDVAGHIVCFEQLGAREVGYWLGKKYWGKGIATKALKEFLKQIETRPLFAHVAKHNVASRRVLEKCGFTISGEDKFFSQAIAKDIDEYILMLNTSHDLD